MNKARTGTFGQRLGRPQTANAGCARAPDPGSHKPESTSLSSPPVEGPTSCHVAGYWKSNRRKADGLEYLHGAAVRDERSTAAIVEFLATTEIGRRSRQARQMAGDDEDDSGEKDDGGSGEDEDKDWGRVKNGEGGVTGPA
jgi:hypothetical protein